MKILLAVSEAAPSAKYGDLSNIAAGLAKELAVSGNVEISVFLPCYRCVLNDPDLRLEKVARFPTPLSWRIIETTLYRAVTHDEGLSYYFLYSPFHFDRDDIYGYGDDPERFAFFSKAVLECLQHLDWYPDVIHANDWHTAFIPVFLKAFYQQLDTYRPIRTLFTIHNLEQQGKTEFDFFGDVLGLPQSWIDTLEFNGFINPVKAAILTSDHISITTKASAKNIRDPQSCHGLQDILTYHAFKLSGIRSGIDTEVYDPEHDCSLLRTYSFEHPEAKMQNKPHLQSKLGLSVEAETPLLILADPANDIHGPDLMRAVINNLSSDDLQLLILHTKKDQYRELFIRYASAYPGKIAILTEADRELFPLAFAAGDMLLIPSRQEPCGSAMQIAMRYGTIPIVQENTQAPSTFLTPEIKPWFTYRNWDARDMLCAIDQAVCAYHDEELRYSLIRSAMSTDYSWKSPASEYLMLYMRCRYPESTLPPKCHP